MKLETTIKPRRDGTVTAKCPGGGVYIFGADVDGAPCSCEVTDERDIEFLIGTGNFYPADDGDYEAVLRISARSDEEAVADAQPPAAGKTGKKGKERK